MNKQHIYKQELYKLTKYEQETVILYNNGELTATVYTCNRILMNKLDRQCVQHPDICRLKIQDEYSKTYIIPKKLISIRTPKIYSDIQKQHMRERGRRAMANLLKNNG